jgi:hypothetical protein
MHAIKTHGTVQFSYSSESFLGLLLDGGALSDSSPGLFIPGENIPIIGVYEAGWDPQSTWIPRKWDKWLAPAENINILPKVLCLSSRNFVVMLLWL